MLRILPYDHEELSAEALRYVQTMAERHGFRVLECDATNPRLPFRIELASSLLKNRIFWAITEFAE